MGSDHTYSNSLAALSELPPGTRLPNSTSRRALRASFFDYLPIIASSESHCRFTHIHDVSMMSVRITVVQLLLQYCTSTYLPRSAQTHLNQSGSLLPCCSASQCRPASTCRHSQKQTNRSRGLCAAACYKGSSAFGGRMRPLSPPSLMCVDPLRSRSVVRRARHIREIALGQRA